MAREFYQAVLAAKENHTWMIEEKEEKKVEALETMKLVEGEPMKTTRVRMTISTDMKKKLVQFIKENLDIFAWSHEDMLWINPSVMVHYFYVSPSFPSNKKRSLPKRETKP